MKMKSRGVKKNQSRSSIYRRALRERILPKLVGLPIVSVRFFDHYCLITMERLPDKPLSWELCDTLEMFPDEIDGLIGWVKTKEGLQKIFVEEEKND